MHDAFEAVMFETIHFGKDILGEPEEMLFGGGMKFELPDRFSLFDVSYRLQSIPSCLVY